MEILIVEDDQLQFQLLRALLTAEGYTVRHAATAMAALEMAHARRPTLILLDASLPDRSGFEVARELRRDPATRRIPIAMLSAATNSATREEAAASGCNEFFTKPIDTRTFAADIAWLLGRGAPADGG